MDEGAGKTVDAGAGTDVGSVDGSADCKKLELDGRAVRTLSLMEGVRATVTGDEGGAISDGAGFRRFREGPSLGSDASVATLARLTLAEDGVFWGRLRWVGTGVRGRSVSVRAIDGRALRVSDVSLLAPGLFFSGASRVR